MKGRIDANGHLWIARNFDGKFRKQYCLYSNTPSLLTKLPCGVWCPQFSTQKVVDGQREGASLSLCQGAQLVFEGDVVAELEPEKEDKP